MGKNFDGACASTAKHLRRSIRLKGYDYSQKGAVIMPNHFHAIVIILGLGTNTVGANGRSPLRMKPKSLSSLMAGFKSSATSRINSLRNSPGVPVWQRNYYEHIIRNEEELNHIREYIINNPLQRQFDRENLRHIQDEIYDNTWGSLEEAIYGKTKNYSREIVE